MANFNFVHLILIFCEMVFVVGGKIEKNWEKKDFFSPKMENLVSSVFFSVFPFFSNQNRFPETRP